MDGIDVDSIKHEIQDYLEEITSNIKDLNDTFECVDNPEWLQVTTDLEGKILEGTKKDGKKYISELDGNERYKRVDTGEWIEFTVKVNNFIPDDSDTSYQNIDTGNDFCYVDCILKLPSSYTPNGTPSKLLCVAHGSGVNLEYLKGWHTYNEMIDVYTNNGYAVFDCNGYGNDQNGCSFWGCPKGIQGYYKAYQYVTQNYNVETSFSVYAFSMGGLTAIGLSLRLFPNIKCIAMAAPVTDLYDAWQYAASRKVMIAAAYEFDDLYTYEQNKTIGCDPTLSIKNIDNDEVFIRTVPPIKIWFGTNDEAVSITAADRLINSIKNSNGIADIRHIQGADHAICYGVNGLSTEYVTWINRFN